MAKNKITLYLDVISPFAYMAFHVLRSSPAFAQCEIQYVPVFLGGIMQATGNKPPVTIKNKDTYTARERERWQKYFNVPMSATMPSPFPQLTIVPMRALCYIERQHPEKLIDAFQALYKALWIESKIISDVATISAAFEAAFGKSFAEEVIAAIGSEEIKGALKSNTDQAFNDGCFGLPFFVATNTKGEKDSFWGVDHLGVLMDHLGIEVKRKEGAFKALL